MFMIMSSEERNLDNGHSGHCRGMTYDRPQHIETGPSIPRPRDKLRKYH